MPAPTLDAIRSGLPSTARFAYLNAGSNGPMVQAAADAMCGQIERACEQGAVTKAAFEEWIGSYASAREAFGRALRATPERIALTHSVTGAVNLGVNGLELGEGDEVVSTDGEHPGLDEPLVTIARRRGVVVRRAPAVESDDPLAEMVRLIGPRTKLVAWSHVLWGTGRILPTAEIAAAAREAGAVSLVDGAQSVGAIAVDPAELGVDLYAIPGQKWLLGPVGTGALWVREGFEETLEIGSPAYFTRNRDLPDAPLWPGARRFDGASLGAASLLGVTAAIGWREEAVGWDEGFALAARATAAVRGVLDEAEGVHVIDPKGPQATLVSFVMDGWEARPLAEALAERGVVGRPLPSPVAVRLSPGFWTSDEDVERLRSALAALKRP
jgi:L-cysteine/cystine lyase